MTGLVRKATLLSACGLLLAGAAMAGVPNAANSTLDTHVRMSDGTTVSGPSFMDGINSHTDFCASTAFTIRDGLNNTVGFASVTIDFSQCAAGAAILCTNQDDPAITIGCLGRTATKNANSAGLVSFNLRGEGLSPNGTLPNCARVYAGGQLMGTLQVKVMRYDLDNTGTVGAGDGTAWVDRFLGVITGDLWGDYDCTLALGAFDGSLMVDAILGALAPCTSCP